MKRLGNHVNSEGLVHSIVRVHVVEHTRTWLLYHCGLGEIWDDAKRVHDDLTCLLCIGAADAS